MNKKNILEALNWLWHNGYSNEVFMFYKALEDLNYYAINIGFSKDPAKWTSILMRKVKKLLLVDKVYSEQCNKHFLRCVNTKSKEDMISLISELNLLCRI